MEENRQIKIPTQLCKENFRFLRLNPKRKEPLANISWKGGLHFNDILLQDHIKNGGNYGVIGGHGSLCILDIDNKEVAEKLSQQLNTFTIKTCGGTKHFYFIINENMENCVLKGDIGEVRVKNYYVVGPNCYAIDEKKNHKGYYDIILNMPIREITRDNFNTIIQPYRRASATSGVVELTPTEDDQSRSAQEFGEVIRLIKKGYTKKQIFGKMNAFAKWSTSHPQYKELTYVKALAKVPKLENMQEFKDTVWELLTSKPIKLQEAVELMAAKFLESRNIFTIKDDRKPEMWIYENGIYVPNGFCEINKWVHDFFKKHYRLQTANKIREKITAMTYINQENFFKNNNEYILPVKNGLLNLRTRDMEEFDQDKIFFSKLKYDFNPNAKINLIEKFIREIVHNEEQYLIIQEFFGSCLIKNYKIQKALMLLGPGSNGKTVLLNLLSRMLGIENIATLAINQMNNKGFSSGELFGKMANICGELNAKTLEDTDIFKQVTGGETIGADRKFKSYIYFRNYAKLISACNQLPKTKDLSDGFFRRWIILEFNNKFVDQKHFKTVTNQEKSINSIKLADPNILDKICSKEEMEGLLAWSYEGLKRLLVNKKFTGNEDIDNTRKKWIENSSTFVEFANQYLEYTGEKADYEFKDDVDSQYCMYCKIKSLIPESINVQKRYMFDLFGAVEKTRIKPDEGGNKAKRAYIAVKMRELEE